MKRRTLDIIFSIGGVVFSLLLLVAGLILTNQSNFAKTYVRDQLTAQKITFTPGEFLSDVEKGATCLVKYGGTPLDSGKKAECYANEYIALHMAESATAAGYDGATYATMGDVLRGENGLAAQLKAAKEAGTATEEIQAKLDAANGLHGTLLTGETLRGLLLTSYGFSVFGDRAGQAALVCYAAAVVLFLLSLAGLFHAFFSKHSKDVLLVAEHPTPEPTA